MKYGIPLIFDEIVTGFRFAYGGAQEYYGVTPDLCTLGKIIGGGFPLAAICGNKELMAHFDQESVSDDRFLPQIGTLSGNPIAAVAGLETLKILKNPGNYDQVFATGRRLMSGLHESLQEYGHDAKVVGEPPLFDVFFTDSDVENYRHVLRADTSKASAFNKLLRERGVFKGDSKFYVSLAHDEDDIQLTLAAFHDAAKALTKI